MSNMRHTAQKLAAQGRFGDTMLLHVSPAEVEGIASLFPGGLTTNPQTGLPEAFFFLPFLASMFGAAAPAAAAAGTAAAAAAPALAATTAAAAAPTLAGTLGSIGTGLSSGLSSLTSGIGSMFGGGAAAAAPAAAAPVGTLLGGGGTSALAGGIGADALGVHTLGTGVTAAAAPAAAAQTLPATMSVLPSASPGVAAALPATMTAPTTLAALPEMAGGAVGTGATTGASTGIGGLLGKLGGSFTMKNLPMWAMGAQALGSLFQGGGGGGKSSGKKKDVSKMKYSSSGSPVFNSPREQDSRYMEHNFFPNYQYANGGIVSLAGGGEVPPDLQAQMPQDMSFPMNGVPAMGGDEAPMLEDIPSSEFPTSQIGSEPEPPVGEPSEPSTHNDRELIAQTVEAIQGKMPDPGPILLAFVKEFGEPALQDLAARVKGMPKTEEGGPPAMPGGDGMSDSIPAMIDGQQPAALSQGEYVIPADAVSGLGNGSTDAGAAHLDELVGSVRQQRTGSPQQPPQMNSGGLIKGYARGGIVGLADGGRVKQYSTEPWSWGDFFNPMSEPPRMYPESPPSGGATRALVVPPMPAPKPYPSDDLADYGPSMFPEAIDRWIPSVQGFTTTGDWFATQPEIRRAVAKRDTPKKKGK